MKPHEWLYPTRPVIEPQTLAALWLEHFPRIPDVEDRPLPTSRRAVAFQIALGKWIAERCGVHLVGWPQRSPRGLQVQLVPEHLTYPTGAGLFLTQCKQCVFHVPGPVAVTVGPPDASREFDNVGILARVQFIQSRFDSAGLAWSRALWEIEYVI